MHACMRFNQKINIFGRKEKQFYLPSEYDNMNQVMIRYFVLGNNY